MAVEIDVGFLSFQHETASAYLDFLADDMAMLNCLKSDMRGVGDGTGLMERICAFADSNHMAVMLYVKAFEYEDEETAGESMNDEQLVKWYQKFGFKLVYSQPQMIPQMIRYPTKEKYRPMEESV